MIQDMRSLAFYDLLAQFNYAATVDMNTLRQERGKEIAAQLVEDNSKIDKAYILQPQANNEVVLRPQQLDDEQRQKLPFCKPSGSQSSAIGPVIKRTGGKDNSSFGPKPETLKTTLKNFQHLAQTPTAWQSYFQEIVDILEQCQLKSTTTPTDSALLEQAVAEIKEQKTVFLAIADRGGRWPGERAEYLAYLAQELADIKYVTQEAPPQADSTCPLCGAEAVTVYPNAVKGSGLNLSNMDRIGAFTALDTRQAWKNYALCLNCADLLYIFNHHLAAKLIGRIAGEKALILPSLLGIPEKRTQLMKQWHKYVQGIEDNKIQSYENRLLRFFADQDDSSLTLQIIWAKFGQNIEEIKGHLTDILPSRLQRLSELNHRCNEWQHPLAPQYPLPSATFDLALNALSALFRRPGGKKAERANASQNLFRLKQQLARAIYHQSPFYYTDNLWDEIMHTARYYLRDSVVRGNGYGLHHEGYNNKKNEPYWTLAGWIRHLARFFYFLDQAGVIPMGSQRSFTPRTETLQPFFQPGSGIDSDAKAFAFLLGILFGKLLQVQERKGINVAANALTWLKRLEISGRDLPELYKKVRGKFFAYDFKKSKTFLALETDLAVLGTQLGDKIELDTTATAYFILLGQSVVTLVLPKKEEIVEAEIQE